MKTKFLFLGAVIALMPASVAAQETPILKPLNAATASGTYAGTFLCSLGEMGMTLTLQDIGPATRAEDIGQEPCRSGSGPCNDRQNVAINRSRTVKGVINFFPLLSNPKAPKGAFSVTGSVNYSLQRFWRIQLSPNEWLENPEDFGWSGLEGTISKGKMSGKPTASGCHTLRMTKIRTAP